MKTMKKFTVSALVLGLFYMFVHFAFAAVPLTINFQGKLTDSAGLPLDGLYKMTFLIYDAGTGGRILWKEKQNVTVVDGIYNVTLGAFSPLFPGLFSNGRCFLEVVILNPDTSFEETLSPRQRITSTAFAIRAGDADTISHHDIAEIALMDDLSAHASDPDAHHSKTTSFSELTDQISDPQIPDAITRDSELAAHALDSAAHHVRYSDPEAVSAMGIKDNTNPLNHDRFTASEAVAAVLENDGTGSGIDADLLDGQHAADIISAAADEVRGKISECGTGINSPGSYYLTQNLNCTAMGIIVNSDDVTIDLMGFTLTGDGDQVNDYGIYVNGKSNTEVRNGTIKRFYNGILSPNKTKLVNVQVLDNTMKGISVGSFSMVKGCTAWSNGANGIFCGPDSIIVHNISTFNNGSGIVTGNGSIVAGNEVSENHDHGIFTGDSCTVSNNIAFGNGMDGIKVYPGSKVSNNISRANAHWGIFLDKGASISARCIVTGNTITNNNQEDHVAWGGLFVEADCFVKDNLLVSNKQNNIYVFSSRNTIEGNVVNNSVNGIFFNFIGNFWAGNRASGNTNNFVNTGGQTDGGGNVGF